MSNVLASIAAACERRIQGKRECIVRVRLMAPSLYTYPGYYDSNIDGHPFPEPQSWVEQSGVSRSSCNA